MTDRQQTEPALPVPSRRHVAGIERPNEHGITIREEIARFKDRQDAVLFVRAYNSEHAGSRYRRAAVWELQYVR